MHGLAETGRNMHGMSLDAAPGLVPSTRARAIADELRRVIITGELTAGSHLRQTEIAKRFGVSTTPVREAFTALAREGFVQQDSHRGVVVYSPSVADVRENYEIRMALEPLAGELAAKTITAEQLDALDAIVDEMRVKSKSDPLYQSSVLNPRFHGLIYEAAERPRLLELITNFRGAAVAYQMVLVAPDLSVPGEYVDEVQAEHEEIAAALRARAPKRAARALRTHIQHNLDQVVAAIPDEVPAAGKR
jgi:DNA-binding GntR family transcriptional regulator